MTQEQFDKLSAEDRAPIQQEIEEAVKRAVKAPGNGVPPSGTKANVLV